MSFLLNFLYFTGPIVVILGLVVTVHEMGHFLAAKAVGTKIDQFSIGFGRPLFSWTDRSGVEWRVGWIPLGGFVRFAGDENAASMPDQDDLESLRRDLTARHGEAEVGRYFHFKPLWHRAVITAAGPVANFLLAVLIFAVLLGALGQLISPARVDAVKPGSPAEIGGFRAGDLILQANGRSIDNFAALQNIVYLKSDTAIRFVVERDGRKVILTATPRRAEIIDRLGHKQHLGMLGISNAPLRGEATIRHYTPLQALRGGVDRTIGVIETTLRYIGRMLIGRESAEQLSGPIGMAQLSGEIAKETAAASPNLPTLLLNALINTLELAANISVGIGFLNLLPIPVLDGGHLLFYAYEAAARRPLPAKVQAAGYRVGLALVLGLMLFATWNDLQRSPVFKLFGGLFS